MIVFGSECTFLVDAAGIYCGEPARWVQYNTAGSQMLNVLCDRHRTVRCQLIPEEAERAPASRYLLRRESRPVS